MVPNRTEQQTAIPLFELKPVPSMFCTGRGVYSAKWKSFVMVLHLQNGAHIDRHRGNSQTTLLRHRFGPDQYCSPAKLTVNAGRVLSRSSNKRTPCYSSRFGSTTFQLLTPYSLDGTSWTTSISCLCSTVGRLGDAAQC